MRTKPGVDTLSFDDLYNNLRVFEFYVKGSTTSSSSTQNVVFVSFDNTNSTNESGHAEDDIENYALMAFNSSNSGSDTEDNPHQTLKGKDIVDSRCSRHMTENKAYLVEYQDFIGGPVAFGCSKGQITGK
nr:hypothetical protein [Tanacetum cinerariifolium]